MPGFIFGRVHAGAGHAHPAGSEQALLASGKRKPVGELGTLFLSWIRSGDGNYLHRRAGKDSFRR